MHLYSACRKGVAAAWMEHAVRCERGGILLTVTFAFLPRVAVVKDALGIVSPGQAAELHPLQHIGQRSEIVRLHETHRHPVRTAAAQTVRKVFTLLRETAHWVKRGTEKMGSDSAQTSQLAHPLFDSLFSATVPSSDSLLGSKNTVAAPSRESCT